MLGELAACHRAAWKDSYAESPDSLRTEVVELLSALRLAQPAEDGLAVFPFAARYQPQVTTRPAAGPGRGKHREPATAAPVRRAVAADPGGIVNVWFYLDNEFSLSGGRMILRGTNGSGKSRALEMLLPFLLDADRRRMDATGAARVSLDELMRTGAQGQSNRTGYLWLELARPGELLTVGALVRHSQSASSSKVWYFTTPLRVGAGLPLMSATREPLSRDALTELIGADRITESAHVHKERVRTEVFGLRRRRGPGPLRRPAAAAAHPAGARCREPHRRRDGCRRSCSSRCRCRKRRSARAGEQLDGLTETRLAQRRLEDSAREVDKFLGVYRRYAADTLRTRAQETLSAATAV